MPEHWKIEPNGKRGKELSCGELEVEAVVGAEEEPSCEVGGTDDEELRFGGEGVSGWDSKPTGTASHPEKLETEERAGLGGSLSDAGPQTGESSRPAERMGVGGAEGGPRPDPLKPERCTARRGTVLGIEDEVVFWKTDEQGADLGPETAKYFCQMT